jgi:hypothetical protein
MSVPVLEERPAIDPVLRRMPSALWRSLPVLLVLGCALLVPVVSASVLVGAANPVIPLLACAVGAPLLLAGVDRLHAELFDRVTARPRPRRRWRRVLRAEAIVLPVGAAASLSLVASAVAGPSGVVLFGGVAVVSALAAVVLGLIAVVALPLAAARPEARIRSVWLVGFYAAVRRPLPAIATAVCGIALAWLAGSGLPGLAALAPGLVATLAVCAAWPTLVAAGVALPDLAPIRSRPDQNIRRARDSRSTRSIRSIRSIRGEA